MATPWRFESSPGHHLLSSKTTNPVTHRVRGFLFLAHAAPFDRVSCDVGGMHRACDAIAIVAASSPRVRVAPSLRPCVLFVRSSLRFEPGRAGPSRDLARDNQRNAFTSPTPHIRCARRSQWHERMLALPSAAHDGRRNSQACADPRPNAPAPAAERAPCRFTGASHLIFAAPIRITITRPTHFQHTNPRPGASRQAGRVLPRARAARVRSGQRVPAVGAVRAHELHARRASPRCSTCCRRRARPAS